jgi:predicted phage terminase large subunit-like protein
MSEDDLDKQIRVAKRLYAATKARDNLLDFMQFTMPDPEDDGSSDLSRYEVTPVARLLTQIMEKVYRRELKRVAISMPPQTGKTQLISRGFPAWAMGKDPRINLMLGSYNQDYADGLGDSVREIMASPSYRQVFPGGVLRVGGKAKSHLITQDNGQAAFIGRGGSGTGRPADIFIIDDPLKDDKEAQSNATREQVWSWFTKVAYTRLHARSAVVVLHTRWHMDDLIGRLCDPSHPDRSKRFAGLEKQWTYINLPAVVEDPELAKSLGLTLEKSDDPFVQQMFGDKPLATLWPGRKSLSMYAETKALDPQGFSALNMGRPTPEEGDYFRAEWLVGYDRDELPEKLTVYGASDHGLGIRTQNDPSCLMCVGVDEEDNIWILPDLVWERMQTDRIVEELLIKMKLHKPAAWWLEKENISKAFGPFLLRRMHEEQIYCVLDGTTPGKDKLTRARSIQGRMSMRKVRFPTFAPWWAAARQELLTFPNGAHDDFVDTLAHVGLGLLKMHRPRAAPASDKLKDLPTNSIGYILASAKLRANGEKRKSATRGW